MGRDEQKNGSPLYPQFQLDVATQITAMKCGSEEEEEVTVGQGDTKRRRGGEVTKKHAKWEKSPRIRGAFSIRDCLDGSCLESRAFRINYGGSALAKKKYEETTLGDWLCGYQVAKSQSLQCWQFS